MWLIIENFGKIPLEQALLDCRVLVCLCIMKCILYWNLSPLHQSTLDNVDMSIFNAFSLISSLFFLLTLLGQFLKEGNFLSEFNVVHRRIDPVYSIQLWKIYSGMNTLYWHPIYCYDLQFGIQIGSSLCWTVFLTKKRIVKLEQGIIAQLS